MSLAIRRPENLEYTHVRVFKETHQRLLDIAQAEKTSLPRVIEALVVYYLESQEAQQEMSERRVG
ncbi:MAG: hypothetical protein JJ934_04885 [Pseudomonadales bacterium]|nr:hypothetical protein [Pseudomonadales bacterium]MBO6565555.1 hypothetical protein [Pseudomonadales bacterium]MBO6595173.1 hypothetical protein [Pseudomonadales bacterium]MBO6656206.1 hypothetical protein [Pseudomonadales bacterium]MBO6701679.1 hypothetical protein [Pseudomonadales bacterium]